MTDVLRREAPFFEDFQPGQLIQHRLGRTVTEFDNTFFTLLTMNTAQTHFNQPYAERTEFGQRLVNSLFTLSVVGGLSVGDLSENAVANLGWEETWLPAPVFVGDTLYAESEILETRESRSRPYAGIVRVRTRGLKQDGTVVVEYVRTFMIYKRGQAPHRQVHPGRGE